MAAGTDAVESDKAGKEAAACEAEAAALVAEEKLESMRGCLQESLNEALRLRQKAVEARAEADGTTGLLEKRRQDAVEYVQKATLMDNFFAIKMFEEREVVNHVLEVLLGREVHCTACQTQRMLVAFNGRWVQLDTAAEETVQATTKVATVAAEVEIEAEARRAARRAQAQARTQTEKATTTGAMSTAEMYGTLANRAAALVAEVMAGNMPVKEMGAAFAGKLAAATMEVVLSGFEPPEKTLTIAEGASEAVAAAVLGRLTGTAGELTNITMSVDSEAVARAAGATGAAGAEAGATGAGATAGATGAVAGTTEETGRTADEASAGKKGKDRKAVYNFEIENSRKGAQPRRGRRNLDFVDITYEGVGDRYGEDLPESMAIIITDKDPLNEPDYPVSVAEWRSRTANKPIDMGAYVYWVKVNYRFSNPDSPLARLVHDFCEPSVEKMRDPVLKERMRQLKENEEEVKKMSEELEKLVNYYASISEAKGKAEGKAEGEAKGEAKGIVGMCLDFGLSRQRAIDALKKQMSLSDEDAAKAAELYGYPAEKQPA